MKQHVNIALFVPHQGCPKDCVFCNQARITGRKRESLLTEETVRLSVEDQLSTVQPEQSVEIAFFGGSFTGLPRGYQTMLLTVAKEFLVSGRVHGIRLSTRPDYIADHIMEFLLSYGVTTVELGCQSMDDEVLELSKRGHTSAHVQRAVEIIRHYPTVKLGLQVLPGLPGDTLEKSMQTIRKIVSLSPDFVRIYPALVISGTELEWLYVTHQYKPLTVEEAVQWVSHMWLPLIEAGIPVIRMGLHSSDDLRSEGTVLAGPFHPSFRQLVEEEIYSRLLNRMMEQIPDGTNDLEVFVHPADETPLRGRRGANWKRFVGLHGHRRVNLTTDRSLQRHQVSWRNAGDLEKRKLLFIHA
ncbi:radical SAM protein [Aneurinibacillus sp. Ricciae_BoGa-3]|uniref:elongator complex protein 3 n=1 Tax=Aneurinibacillus sp. Ricciae_BoGa-3 TaxID=3022697 RepID=UPI00233FED44|nr:radical SAM protein [Aneurinibacillus sp. Ricciae_BoGa-3]WCK53010.1 radical SAM protein [Aneurinibacillus sp. Ricciae_BoGa-3]